MIVYASWYNCQYFNSKFKTIIIKLDKLITYKTKIN